ncbi:sigma 54-interacting transcriptional regulator [Alkalihalobacillus sp. MEB130]|uniref:sigma 54-interacting transcriptional regulator n=1 Tax=Alkalihalobacillus sp. MEB130 TaxID=2976704 RepID=UPI0028DEC893|nr:sigma 54-interacting transcriptional regulator [Alkalihalobacillus sp. MEB130]MDT8862001.1 sigma 54-interacting transcriptional regulator [Alkalihalobacillus sp. MEB130]
MDNSVVNQISLIDESDLQAELQVQHWMAPPHFLVYEGQSLKEILEMMQHKNEDLILINTDHNVLGIVTQQKINHLYLQGVSLDVLLEEVWVEETEVILPETSILHITLNSRVVPIVNHDSKIIGSISSKELLLAQEFLISSIKHNVNVIDIILDIAYEGVTLVDRNGFIVKMNEAYRNFLGIRTKDVIGKHVTDVIENTELHTTAKTGIPQRGEIQVIRGQKMIVHRIPIWQNNELIGAIGMLIFEGVSELYRILENATSASTDFPKTTRNRIGKETQKQPSSINVLDRILGVSDEILACKRLTKKASTTSATVLITGESGTGKEVFAQAIHQLSGRSEGPFIAINCAAIPENLLESELFGYEEGAFTGAKKGGSVGKFELANEGTIFLDEIGDMPKHMQTKILRVLEEREVMKVGGIQTVPISVRVIAATHQNLLEKVNEGSFREDLYYRLNVIELTIPPLRRRQKDIPILFTHYLKKYFQEYKVQEKKVAPEVINKLMNYDWPGNIRQLVNTTEQLVTLVEEDVIEVSHLPAQVKDQSRTTVISQSQSQPLKRNRMEQEKATIEEILEEVGGNKTEAAKRLGIHRTTIYKKLKQYNLE